jgi:hypothetical protein
MGDDWLNNLMIFYVEKEILQKLMTRRSYCVYIPIRNVEVMCLDNFFFLP